MGLYTAAYLKIKDVSEHSASILASYGWIEIQMAGINKISEPGAALSDTYTRYVNPSFFRNI